MTYCRDVSFSIILVSLYPLRLLIYCYFFFFNDTATTEIYTLSLHDALPISVFDPKGSTSTLVSGINRKGIVADTRDRKSTRLNSSHSQISYAVFCLKKKKKKKKKKKNIKQKLKNPQ